MGMKTTTGNPLEIYLAFDPEKHWKVIESDTAPFIADDKNPEWYIKLSEFDAAQARIAALEAENERLRNALLECDEYFDNRADADCDQDGYIPNEEMKMLTVVREVIGAKP